MAQQYPPQTSLSTAQASDALHDAEAIYKEAAAALRKAEAAAEKARRALMVSQATDALEELAKISTTEHFQAVIGKLEQAREIAKRMATKGRLA